MVGIIKKNEFKLMDSKNLILILKKIVQINVK